MEDELILWISWGRGEVKGATVNMKELITIANVKKQILQGSMLFNFTAIFDSFSKMPPLSISL
jgi:hypothetical protein